MAVVTYISFAGNCHEAVGFYADVFGLEPPAITTYGSQKSDFPLPDTMKDLVMHTKLDLMGGSVMFSDTFDTEHFQVGNNITLTLVSDDKKALENAFHKLAEGGEVKMPLQETFWSSLYGFVTDKFGIGWQVSHEPAQS